MKAAIDRQEFEVIADLAAFDRGSGNPIERALFNHRGLLVTLCLLITAFLAFQATRLQLNASFVKTIPATHPFVLEYLEHESDLKGLTNVVRIVVEARQGQDIFDPGYLDLLRRINDEVYLVPGVDRAFVKSLWMPATRWQGVTENGFDGGPVIGDGYDGSPASIAQVRANVERSGEIGQLVALDFRSSIIHVPLLDFDPESGAALDYRKVSQALEDIRGRYEAEGVRVRTTGFAKVMGDLIEGVQSMIGFFALAVAISTALLYAFTRCWRSTLLVQLCSLVAVVWLLGLLALSGRELDPYSILVPFLVYAIGISHGAQKMNGIMQDIGRGTHRVIAARYTFRRLFVAGATALLADVAGFAVLTVIDIPVIRELALVASIGVGILIFTNLALLPVLLSTTGVSPRAAQRSLATAADDARSEPQAAAHPLWKLLDRFTDARVARLTIGVAIVLAVAAAAVGSRLRIGDLDAGAPELRPDSRYNLDSQYVVGHYLASSDVLVVMVRTPPGECAAHSAVRKVDALEWRLRQLPGVEGTQSVATLARAMSAGMNEGSLKWAELIPNQAMVNLAVSRAPRELLNASCELLLVQVLLADHMADTLDRVVAEVNAFAAEHDGDDARFLLAGGNAGIEAATNIVIRSYNLITLLGVYLMVAVLCLIAFRSWRATLCALLPLALTSLMAEALMVMLGIGVKVATLPVVALGVGIGVDYALYVLSVIQGWLRRGATLSQAYLRTLQFTGRVVVFTGITLSLGVITWTLSPIKFQADMGILLTFMFLWNMVGALVLIPALARLVLVRDAPEGVAGAVPAAQPST